MVMMWMLTTNMRMRKVNDHDGDDGDNVDAAAVPAAADDDSKFVIDLF